MVRVTVIRVQLLMCLVQYMLCASVIQLFRERMSNWKVSKRTQQCWKVLWTVVCAARLMQSRSNVMAERLPERPILGFYENVRNVSHTTFRHCRVCTLVLVNLSRNSCIYIIGTTHVFGCSEIVCSLAGKVFKVVLQAMLKTGTAF